MGSKRIGQPMCSPSVEPPPQHGHISGSENKSTLLSSPESAQRDSEDLLCERCKCIDFEKAFQWNAYRGGSSRRVHPLGQLSSSSATSKCKLCRFFVAMKSKQHDGVNVPDKATTYSLVATLAWRLLMPNKKDKVSDFQDIVTLVVVPSSWKKKVHRKGVTHILSTPATSCEDKDVLFPRQLRPNQLDYTVIKGWLEFCKENHQACHSGQITVPGLKLIDCSSRKIVPATTNCDYIALSYVWGKQHQEESKPSNNLLAGFTLPTIEDTMIVAKELGIGYIWVDRYCIDQDNDEEKHNLISRMDQIYRSAVLTIIAAAGKDSSFGLPGVSTPRLPQPSTKIGQRLLVSSLPDPSEEFNNSKYATRGWTYQEGLLSSRRLVFTKSQVYFQCSAMHCLESIGLNDVALKTLHTKDSQMFHSGVTGHRIFPYLGTGSCAEYADRVTEYIRRELSHEKIDTLNAFLGVLNALMSQKRLEKTHHTFEGPRIPGVFHFWGVPSWRLSGDGSSSAIETLLFNISWRTIKSDTRLRKRAGFPSWSLLSWTDLPNHDSVCFPSRLCYSEFLRFENKPTTVQIEAIQTLLTSQTSQTSHLMDWNDYYYDNHITSAYNMYTPYLYVDTWSTKVALCRVRKFKLGSTCRENWEVEVLSLVGEDCMDLYLTKDILKESGSEEGLARKLWDGIVLGCSWFPNIITILIVEPVNGDTVETVTGDAVEPVANDITLMYERVERVGILYIQASLCWERDFKKVEHNEGYVGERKFTRSRFRLE